MDFVAEENVRRFRRLLILEEDPEKRAVIALLLEREEAKLRIGTAPRRYPATATQQAPEDV